MYPDWAQPSDADNQYLPEMLKFGSDNYLRQTSWFLHHRDTGFRNLAAVLAAELAVVSLHFANVGVPDVPTAVILTSLGLFAVPLSISAYRSCGRAFRASLESVVLIAKAMWAMGLMDKVLLADTRRGPEPAPVPKDLTFYVPRFSRDSREKGIVTTDGFVEAHLQDWQNTCNLAKWTIWIFCVGAVVTGLVGAIMALIAPVAHGMVPQ